MGPGLLELVDVVHNTCGDGLVVLGLHTHLQRAPEMLLPPSKSLYDIDATTD